MCIQFKKSGAQFKSVCHIKQRTDTLKRVGAGLAGLDNQERANRSDIAECNGGAAARKLAKVQ